MGILTFLVVVALLLGALTFWGVRWMLHDMDYDCLCDKCRNRKTRDEIRRRERQQWESEMRRAVDEVSGKRAGG